MSDRLVSPVEGTSEEKEPEVLSERCWSETRENLVSPSHSLSERFWSESDESLVHFSGSLSPTGWSDSGEVSPTQIYWSEIPSFLKTPGEENEGFSLADLIRVREQNINSSQSSESCQSAIEISLGEISDHFVPKSNSEETRSKDSAEA